MAETYCFQFNRLFAIICEIFNFMRKFLISPPPVLPVAPPPTIRLQLHLLLQLLPILHLAVILTATVAPNHVATFQVQCPHVYALIVVQHREATTNGSVGLTRTGWQHMIGWCFAKPHFLPSVKHAG
eukprot:sb/3475491/